MGLGEVWPGVRVSLRAHGHDVEKIFTVSPGADPSRIRMRVRGARSLTIDGTGALVASSHLGEAKMTPPIAWQERDGERRPVRVAYEVRGNRYGFRLGPYDRGLPLVIDPLVQATYVGGTSNDNANALAISPASPYDIYVAGYTGVLYVPQGRRRPVAGRRDAFVAHLSGDLTTLLEATYLGAAEPTASPAWRSVRRSRTTSTWPAARPPRTFRRRPERRNRHSAAASGPTAVLGTASSRS